MNATWYVTEAGEAVDPAECLRKNGVLIHKSGAKIAMRFPDCPRSRSVDPDAERAKKAASAKKELFGGKGDHDGDGKAGGFIKPVSEATETRDLTAEKPKRTYKTRESKAD